jgi:hypothetical protein
MPTQDRVRSGQTMAAQCSGEPPREGGEHGPVRPVQTRQWVSAAQDSDLVAQHEELMSLVADMTHCRIIPSTCEKIKYSNRSDTRGSCPTSDRRWAATQARLLAPHGLGSSQAVGAGGQLSFRALFSFPCRRHAANTSTTF